MDHSTFQTFQSEQTVKTKGETGLGTASCEREYLFAIMAVYQQLTMHINAGDQTTKIQNYRCNKYLPVSLITNTVISQYLFTSADKMKYNLQVI